MMAADNCGICGGHNDCVDCTGVPHGGKVSFESVPNAEKASFEGILYESQAFFETQRLCQF